MALLREFLGTDTHTHTQTHGTDPAQAWDTIRTVCMYIHAYIPIHNVLTEAVSCCFAMFTDIFRIVLSVAVFFNHEDVVGSQYVYLSTKFPVYQCCCEIYMLFSLCSCCPCSPHYLYSVRSPCSTCSPHFSILLFSLLHLFCMFPPSWRTESTELENGEKREKTNYRENGENREDRENRQNRENGENGDLGRMERMGRTEKTEGMGRTGKLQHS